MRTAAFLIAAAGVILILAGLLWPKFQQYDRMRRTRAIVDRIDW